MYIQSNTILTVNILFITKNNKLKLLRKTEENKQVNYLISVNKNKQVWGFLLLEIINNNSSDLIFVVNVFSLILIYPSFIYDSFKKSIAVKKLIKLNFMLNNNFKVLLQLFYTKPFICYK